MFSAGSAAAGADLPSAFCIKLDYFWSNMRDCGLLALGLLKGDSFAFGRGSVVSSGSNCCHTKIIDAPEVRVGRGSTAVDHCRLADQQEQL
jgi:hypothetical protein